MAIQTDVAIVGKFLSTLPEDDDHPYRTGPWTPQTSEWDADDLTVEGEIPRDLAHLPTQHRKPTDPAFKTYHPFERRRMLPRRPGFRDGKAFYPQTALSNRWIPGGKRSGRAAVARFGRPVQLASGIRAGRANAE